MIYGGKIHFGINIFVSSIYPDLIVYSLHPLTAAGSIISFLCMIMH